MIFPVDASYYGPWGMGFIEYERYEDHIEDYFTATKAVYKEPWTSPRSDSE